MGAGYDADWWVLRAAAGFARIPLAGELQRMSEKLTLT